MNTDSFKTLGTRNAIRKLYEGTPFKQCANPCLEANGVRVVTSSTMLLEGIDFDLTYFPLRHLGYKAVLSVTGELFGSMSTPAVLKVVIAVSAKLDYPQVAQIWEGIVSAAKEFGYKDVALELLPSLTGLSICVTAGGTSPMELAAKRPIAKSMDLICLSNNPGAAFLGNQLLLKGKEMKEEERQKKLKQYTQLVGAYLKPELSPYTVSSLNDSGIVPSFGYFCREPLSVILRRLCEASGLGAKIYADRIPFAGGSIDAARELKLDPLQAALKGGDDYCMLYTVPIGCHERFRHDFQAWDVIGHLAKPEVGLVVVSPDGLEHEI